MQLTNVLLFLGLASVGLSNPVPEAELEQRNLIPLLCLNWKCVKYQPSCLPNWKPMYCSKGWGDKNCVGWCKLFLSKNVFLLTKRIDDGCDQGKTYCCSGGKCW
jgi:hypothetical protein